MEGFALAIRSTSAELPRGSSAAPDGLIVRHGLLLAGASPVAANLVASTFNILYNSLQIEPLLTDEQNARFQSCWQAFNLTVYPLAIACWAWPLWRMRDVHAALVRGEAVDADRLARVRRQVVNLPWRIFAVAATCWLLCAVVFPTSLARVGSPLDSAAVWHLITSFWTAGLIAVTHSFFAVELTSQRVLFPLFFRDCSPASVPGAAPLSVTTRGVLWALSAAVCPVVSLVLLLLVPQAQQSLPLFGLAVAGVAILYAVTTSWMMGKLVAKPIQALREASMRVARGDLDARVDLQRADDFGPLIERFNQMVAGLREREHLEQTFGRHVGREAARQILAQGDHLGGSELEVTVMFVDIRNFTAQAERRTPAEMIDALNIFFTAAVDTVERHGGLVNKFLGDGLMAIFGVGANRDLHADRAVTAARALFELLAASRDELARSGWPAMTIGIGVNTGQAVVGSIGSPRRREYTAIGDTVNVAARVEGLTKQLDRTLLITDATRKRLACGYPLERLPPQTLRGKSEPLPLFAVAPLAPGETAATFSLTESVANSFVEGSAPDLGSRDRVAAPPSPPAPPR